MVQWGLGLLWWCLLGSHGRLSAMLCPGVPCPKLLPNVAALQDALVRLSLSGEAIAAANAAGAAQAGGAPGRAQGPGTPARALHSDIAACCCTPQRLDQ